MASCTPSAGTPGTSSEFLGGSPIACLALLRDAAERNLVAAEEAAKVATGEEAHGLENAVRELVRADDVLLEATLLQRPRSMRDAVGLTSVISIYSDRVFCGSEVTDREKGCLSIGIDHLFAFLVGEAGQDGLSEVEQRLASYALTRVRHRNLSTVQIG